MGIRKATVGIVLLGALGLADGAPAVGQEGEFIYKPPNLGRSDLPERAPDVPYVPTPQVVVDAMLALADVKPGDVLYDLGSGDGRIVVTAAQRFGVRGVGIDINPERIQEAEANARSTGPTRATCRARPSGSPQETC